MQQPDRLEFNLDAICFEMFTHETKDVEIRINRGKFAEVRKDHLFVATNKENGDKFIGVVNRVSYYVSFKEAVAHEGIQHVWPRLSNIKDIVNIYRGFPGYADQEKYHQVVAISLDKHLLLAHDGRMEYIGRNKK
jgi:ASC-1-like (ASCH) protein